MSDDLVERLTNAAAWIKKLIDAPHEVYSVPLTDNRMAVKRDDILMAQFRLSEAADRITTLTAASLAQVTAENDRMRRDWSTFCGDIDQPIDTHDAVAYDINARIEAVAADNAKLRQIISDCAAALPNGAGIAPTASLDFMQMLPGEIASVCAALTTGATK